MMKTRMPFVFAALLICIILSGCGPTPAEQAATMTQIAVNDFATQMAEVPTATTTFTPSPTNTATLTLTPSPIPTDTSTPTPTIVSLPGWEKFEGSGIEIWLPESYEGGDIANDLDVVVSKLKTLGPDFEQAVITIETNPSIFVIWVFDSNVGDRGFLTNVNIGQEQVVSAVTLEFYLSALANQLPSIFTIVDQQIVQLERYEAARLIIEADISGVMAKELIYIIKNKNTIWVITYATEINEFEERVSVFDQSAQTFFIQP